MLKIIDVDWIADYRLQLSFNDGYVGQADLADIFSRKPFAEITDFKRFALTADGCLRWGEHELSANVLRDISQGAYLQAPVDADVAKMEEIIKQASWDSIVEGRPDILQAAIRAYVERYGHSQVVAKAGIKSRTSAYRSLQADTKPNFDTLVKLGHAVVELARSEAVGDYA